MIRASILLGLGVALAACTAERPGAPAPAPGLYDTDWQAVRLDGRAIAEPVPWIRFGRDGSTGGNTGCNHFGGRHEADGASLKIDGLFATRMACAAPVMAQERAFLRVLEAADHHEIRDGRLTLSGTAGRVGLVPR